MVKAFLFFHRERFFFLLTKVSCFFLSKQGVAFYTGSQQGQAGLSDGYLLYALANKRCENFKTCGVNGDAINGVAKVNQDIFREFQIGQQNLVNGNCPAARQQKERIAALMAVPLVQGTLRYAYLTDPNFYSNISEKANAEAAVFAASVLPIVNACSSADAEIIYENMAVGSPGTYFSAVKAAFERNYDCMGISSKDVGGLFDSLNGNYMQSAAPPDTGSSSGGLSGGAIAGICIGAAVVVIGAGYLIYRSKKSGGIDSSYANGHSAKSNGAAPEQNGVA